MGVNLPQSSMFVPPSINTFISIYIFGKSGLAEKPKTDVHDRTGDSAVYRLYISVADSWNL